MQIISGTIRLYTCNPRKIDYILKRSYNDKLDIKCVGAGVGNTGTPYILMVANNDLFSLIDEFNRKVK